METPYLKNITDMKIQIYKKKSIHAGLSQIELKYFKEKKLKNCDIKYI